MSQWPLLPAVLKRLIGEFASSKDLVKLRALCTRWQQDVSESEALYRRMSLWLFGDLDASGFAVQGLKPLNDILSTRIRIDSEMKAGKFVERKLPDIGYISAT